MDNSARLISLNEVCKRTSLSRTYINRMRSSNRFPEPVQLSERRIAFVEAEIDQWIADRLALRTAKSVN